MCDGVRLKRDDPTFSDTPLVSALMPTANRAAYVPGAIRCFLAQTYSHSELVILDDGQEPLAYLIPANPRIRYYLYAGPKVVLGKKRNALCDLARGSVIVHWDDDDWYAPGRIEDQVGRLRLSGKNATGYHRFFYWDEEGAQAYEYRFTGAGPYASGSTQCYLKSWWRMHPFSPVASSEDSVFSFEAERFGQLVSVPAGDLMVARGHRGNTWKQPFGSYGFPPVEVGRLPAAFLAEIGVKA